MTTEEVLNDYLIYLNEKTPFKAEGKVEDNGELIRLIVTDQDGHKEEFSLHFKKIHMYKTDVEKRNSNLFETKNVVLKAFGY